MYLNKSSDKYADTWNIQDNLLSNIDIHNLDYNYESNIFQIPDGLT